MAVPQPVRPMVEAGLMAAIAIIFALISAYVPLVGIIVNFLWPVPIVLLGVRHGLRWSIMATVVAGMMIAVLVHPLHALSVVISLGLIGILLGHTFRHGYGPVRTMVWGTAASLVSKLAIVGIGIVTTGINPLYISPDTLQQASEQVMVFAHEKGFAEPALAELRQNLAFFVKFVPLAFPASLCIGAVADTFLNFVIARRMLRRFGIQTAGFASFMDWALPRWILYGYVAGMVAVYWGQTHQIDLLLQLGFNVQLIGTMLLMLQGMSVFYYLADKYNLSRLQSGIILVLTVVVPYLAQLALFAGAFDMVMDFRNLRMARSD